MSEQTSASGSLIFFFSCFVLKKLKSKGLAFELCHREVPPPAQTKVLLLWIYLELGH